MKSNNVAQRHLIATALATVIGPAWAQSSASGAELQRVEITGRAARGYTAGDSSTATKSPTPLLETPMAVQVVPREVIDDQKARTSLEAVQNLSGIQSSTYQFYDQFLIRGFDSGYGVTFRNGLQLQGINEAVNMAFVERVEVIKGPSSMLYGRIEPGGFVNVVTKKPQPAAAYSAELEGGRWGFARATADATGPISQDGTWLYRVTANLDRSGSWVDNAHRDNKAIAATVAWRPGTTFDANLQFEHYDYRTTWLDASIPIIGDRPAPLPRNFSIIYPQSWSSYPYTTNRSLVAFEWNLALSDTWRLAQRLHYVDSSENQQGVYADNFDGVDSFTGVRFTHTGPGWVRKTLSTNLDLSGEFTTAEVRHKVLAGVDWFKFTDDSPGSSGDIAGAAPLGIFAPVYADYSSVLRGLVASDATNIIYRDRSRDTGLYFQDQMSFGLHWELLVGGRFDRATDAYADTYGNRSSTCYPNCTGYPVTAYPTDKAFSPRLGVLYKLSSAASAYATYAKSFGTSNGPDADGKPIPPQKGTQYELGFKATLLDGRVNTSASLFDLTKTNIAEYDPVNFLPHIVGEARSRGLEFDLAGQVTNNLSLIGSATWDRAVITKDPVSGTEGKRFPGAASRFANVWAKYDTAPGAAQGWAVGAGLYVVAQRQGDDANTWQLPGYGRLDAMLAWRAQIGSQKFSAQLNVKNLLDKTYFDHGGSGAAAYGAPRSVGVSLRADF